MKAREPLFLTFLILCIAVVPGTVPADRQGEERESAEWISVRIHTWQGEQVAVQLPLPWRDLIEEIVDFDSVSRLTEGKAALPLALLANLLGQLKDNPPQEILAVEAEPVTVQVATQAAKRTESTEPASTLRISVKPIDQETEKLRASVPLCVLEMVARAVQETPISEADLEALDLSPDRIGLRLNAVASRLPEIITCIQEAGPIDLVHVKRGNVEVRIWTE